MPKFISQCVALGEVALPVFSGMRIQMMPIVLGDMDSIPPLMERYRPLVSSLFDVQGRDGEVGYITIDESLVSPGKAHRRPGIHIDCGTVIMNEAGQVIYCGHGGGGHGASAPPPPVKKPKPTKPKPTKRDPGKPKVLQFEGNLSSSDIAYGMFMVSSHVGCQAWNQTFDGLPGDEGDCEHLKNQCDDESKVILQPNVVYWGNDLCVHESVRMEQEVSRQFIRLSMPSDAPWFEGYTENPLGVMPAGVILPRRKQMDYSPSSHA